MLRHALLTGNMGLVKLFMNRCGCDLHELLRDGALVALMQQTPDFIAHVLNSKWIDHTKLTVNGKPLLIAAAAARNEPTVKILVTDHGVDPNLLGPENETALMVAAENCCMEICKLLLGSPKCDPNLSAMDGVHFL
jgi:ankyrin repeat protein